MKVGMWISICYSFSHDELVVGISTVAVHVMVGSMSRLLRSVLYRRVFNHLGCSILCIDVAGITSNWVADVEVTDTLSVLLAVGLPVLQCVVVHRNDTNYLFMLTNIV